MIINANTVRQTWIIMNFSWINQVVLSSCLFYCLMLKTKQRMVESNTQLTPTSQKEARKTRREVQKLKRASTWTLPGLFDSLSASIITHHSSFLHLPAHIKPKKLSPESLCALQRWGFLPGLKTHTNTHSDTSGLASVTPGWRDAVKIHQTTGGSCS